MSIDALVAIEYAYDEGNIQKTPYSASHWMHLLEDEPTLKACLENKWKQYLCKAIKHLLEWLNGVQETERSSNLLDSIGNILSGGQVGRVKALRRCSCCQKI